MVKIKDDQRVVFIWDHKCKGWNPKKDDVALDRRFQTAVRPQNETVDWLVASLEWIGGLVLRLKCGRRFAPETYRRKRRFCSVVRPQN